MHVGVAYADIHHQVWLRLEIPEGCTVREAIEHSGILDRVPSIDLGKHKVGIYGKIVKLDAPVQDSDRVEIYRPLIADPKKVPRRDMDDDDDDDDDDD